MTPTALVVLSALAAQPSFNGWLSERATFTRVRDDALLSTADVPAIDLLSEANVQARARLLDEALLLSVDASAFLSASTGFMDYDPDVGAVVGVGDDPLAVRVRPFVVFAEAYAQLSPIDHLVLTAGKRRVVWGPGMMASATDVLNPPRDPTDPSSQREGAVLVAIDAPFETFTLTAMALPLVLEEHAGIPAQLLVDDDDDVRYAAVLRAYALVFDADVNAWLVQSNLWDDGREDQTRFMATGSKTIFDVHEVHAEVALKRGSGRLHPNDECLPEELDVFACAAGGVPLFEAKRADEDRLHLDFLVGWRWMLDDESMIAAEWLYQSDGLLPAEHDDFTALIDTIGRLQRDGLAPPGVGAPGSTSASASSAPQRFDARFVRRHHVFASYTKPRIAEDFTVSGTIIVAPEDLTSLVAASASWSAQEWLTLSLSGYAPIVSPLSFVDDELIGEYDLVPFAGRVIAEAKVWF